MITQQHVIEQATADPAKRAALYRAIGIAVNYWRELNSGRNGFFANMRRQRRLTEVGSAAASFVNKLRDADGNALSEEDQRGPRGLPASQVAGSSVTGPTGPSGPYEAVR